MDLVMQLIYCQLNVKLSFVSLYTGKTGRSINGSLDSVVLVIDLILYVLEISTHAVKLSLAVMKSTLT